MRGKGVPKAKGGRGDQFVTLVAELPKTASPAVAEALDRLEAALEADSDAMPRRAAMRKGAADDNSK